MRIAACFCVLGLGLLAAAPALAAEDACATLERLYPQPGRQGAPGDNAYRPLPILAPVRSEPGAPGTLSAIINADHVSPAPAGAPGYVYVGNYQVNNIPVFRVGVGAKTSSDVIRPEDGKKVHMTNDCLDGPDWGFGGTQLALVQGDTLDMLFRSKLDYDSNTQLPQPTNGAVPCDSSNLHTHGLLVSPYHPSKAGLGPYGDYIYDVTMPHHNPDWGTEYDTCGTYLGEIENHKHGLTSLPLHYSDYIPGTPGSNGLRSGEHPSGLFWYHPHPHGFAKIQVHGGTTGAITIGSLTDYACPAGDGTPHHCNLSNANVRVMALKDTELQSSGGGGMWSTVVDPESGFCYDHGGVRKGECQASEALSPGKWVFTVNGVQYPTIRPGAGKMEIWRLINASNGLMYSLSLRKIGQDGNQTSIPFQVLASDGVSIGQNQDGAVIRTELLLTASSRVEIAIPAPEGGGEVILHNDGIKTGNRGSGDTWPSFDLARVVWEKGDANTQVAQAGPVAVEAPDVAAQTIETPDEDASIPARCRFKTGDTRVIYYTHRFSLGFDPNKPANQAAPPSGGSQLEIFGLIAGVRHADGTMDFFNSKKPEKVLHHVRDVWTAGIDGQDGSDFSFPAFMHNPWSTICTVKGSVEPWEMQNYTGEIHNFHLHQSKFTLNPNGVFQYPIPETYYPKELLRADQLVEDFTADNLNPLTYHDNIPVPRGQSFCEGDKHLPGCKPRSLTDNLECTGEPGALRCANPGKTSVIADFRRLEQVGTFVYHCHILEHEDGGMMAQITVLCPPNDTKCAQEQARSAPICKPTEASVQQSTPIVKADD
jgi:FtsP/CotA-like multicopper oxidase with cupredoxin domain